MCFGMDVPVPLKFHLEIRARNQLQRYSVPSFIVPINQDRQCSGSGRRVQPRQPSLEKSLAVHGLTHHELGPSPGESAIVVCAA